MNSFNDFGIKPATKAFTGDKIKMSKILNLEIIVHDYKIEDSKFKGHRLDLQIEYNGEKKVTWTGSNYMIEMIKQVPSEKFPFKTKIVEEYDRLIFS